MSVPIVTACALAASATAAAAGPVCRVKFDSVCNADEESAELQKLPDPKNAGPPDPDED
jgi:hypothetical protein